jgi:pimeloyl-ACP methyl ester carboxylesterase
MNFRFRLIVALLWILPCCILCSRSQAQSCHALRHVTLPASALALPTTGASISSAHIAHQGSSSFCKVLGRIHPIDSTADDIRFELNLPEAWNGKVIQYGGGTFDGYLRSSSGLKGAPVSVSSAPTPLERGFATFGSDSGHHRNYFPFPDAVNSLNAKFARNDEMRHNFDGDALKKAHDAAVAIIAMRYQRKPERMYFVGGSTGGREALRVAQRYPDDYDGVLAAYAAWDQIELDLQFIRTAQALYAHGGFLGHAQTSLIQRTVLKACDAADGLRDKIVSDPDDCRVPASSLRCVDGGHHHGCLSDTQWHTLEVFATPQQSAFTVEHNTSSIPGYNVLSGASLTTATGLLPFALRDPVFVFNSFGYVIGDDVLRNFLSVGRHYNALYFNTSSGIDERSGNSFMTEIVQQAQDIDSSNPDLTTFAAHGGKLILLHGASDVVIPTKSSIDYYDRVRSTVGVDAAMAFMRLYIIPGMGHGYGTFNAGFDGVGALDAWVEKGTAPSALVITDNHSGRTRPLCEYPGYARYTAGDPKVASSFVCVLPTEPATEHAAVE